MTNFIKSLLVIRCQADEDAKDKFSESKDRSSKPPRNISEKRMFGKNVRRLLKLVTRALLNPHKRKNFEIILANSHVFKVYLTWDIQEYYLEHLKGG